MGYKSNLIEKLPLAKSDLFSCNITGLLLRLVA